MNPSKIKSKIIGVVLLVLLAGSLIVNIILGFKYFNFKSSMQDESQVNLTEIKISNKIKNEIIQDEIIINNFFGQNLYNVLESEVFNKLNIDYKKDAIGNRIISLNGLTENNKQYWEIKSPTDPNCTINETNYCSVGVNDLFIKKANVYFINLVAM